MTLRHRSAFQLSGLLCLMATPAFAASECQPLVDAYAARVHLPIFKLVVTTPGMSDAVELIVTSDTLFSRVGAKDEWSRVPLDTPTRARLLAGMPTETNITDCRKLGPEKVGDVAATAYQFTPSAEFGNAPGEVLTVLVGDEKGLPLLETASKAGTSVAIIYDGVTAPDQ